MTPDTGAQDAQSDLHAAGLTLIARNTPQYPAVFWQNSAPADTLLLCWPAMLLLLCCRKPLLLLPRHSSCGQLPGCTSSNSATTLSAAAARSASSRSVLPATLLPSAAAAAKTIFLADSRLPNLLPVELQLQHEAHRLALC
jgi:hypothetical protein